MFEGCRHRKPTKKEAEEFGLDEVMTNSIWGQTVSGSTDITLRKQFSTSSFDFAYTDDSMPYEYHLNPKDTYEPCPLSVLFVKEYILNYCCRNSSPKGGNDLFSF